MNCAGASFHHFGLAVHDPRDAFTYLSHLGYVEGREEYDPLQHVNVAMRHHAQMPDVEVIWPGNEISPIDKLLRGKDSLIYHLCYTVRDAEQFLMGFEKSGLQVHTVVDPRPAILFGGLEVSFHVVGGIGLIELIHGEL